jgi:hypothetical protein
MEREPFAPGDQLMRARYADTDDLLAALTDLPAVACRYGYADEAVGDNSPNIVALLTHLAESYQAAGRPHDSRKAFAAAREAAARDPGDTRLAALLTQSQQRIEQLEAGHALRCGQK